MSYSTPIPIPPKTLAVLAERTKTLDGCVRLSEKSNWFEFPQNGNVASICVEWTHGLHTGHTQRNPAHANSLREIIKARTQT